MFLKILLTFFILQAALVLCIFADKIEEKEAALAARNYSGKSTELMGSFADGSSSCGDTLRASDGAISYKHFQNVLPNERCVWVVRAPNVTTETQYSVSLVGLGIPLSVIIQGFDLGGVLVNTTIPTAASDFTIHSSILVITFYTGPAVSGRGFSLRYVEYKWDEGIAISYSSEDIVVPANIGHIKYPAGTKLSYEDYEVSPIVFIPLPDASVSGGFKKTNVVYIRNELEGVNSCIDSLKVYTFDGTLTAADKWRLQGEICSGVDSEVITNNDLILILFQSDFSIVGSGFHLYATAN